VKAVDLMKGACSIDSCDPSPYTQVYASGEGNVSGPAAPDIQNLQVSVSFAKSIPNADACLSVLERALANNRQADIHGTGAIAPNDTVVTGSQGAAEIGSISSPSLRNNFSLDPAVVISNLIKTVDELVDGSIPPIPFTQPYVGVVFSEVTSCTEGDPSPASSPFPLPSVLTSR
jgi:hypothetical protein